MNQLKMASFVSTCRAMLMLSLAVVQYTGVQSHCTWPSQFLSKTFEDSGKGTLTFDGIAGMTGYSAVAYAQTISSWTCHDVSYFASENLIIMKSNQLQIFAHNWHAFLCWEVSTLSSVSYRYYTLANQQANAGEHRLYLIMDRDTPTKAQLCDTTNRASGAEFNDLIEQGNAATAKLTCPDVFLGRFEFGYTQPDGTVMCTATSPQEHINVCTDKTSPTLDEPCSGLSMFYATGSVYCVDSVVSGNDTFIQFYNPQAAAVDNTNTYRFSCMAISSDSTAATIVYNNCTNHQKSTYAARTHAGVQIGATMTLFPYLFCQRDQKENTSSCPDDGDDSAREERFEPAFVAAIVLACLVGLLLIVIAVLVLMVIKGRRGKAPKTDDSHYDTPYANQNACHDHSYDLPDANR